jgi:hypothetical protein
MVHAIELGISQTGINDNDKSLHDSYPMYLGI